MKRVWHKRLGRWEFSHSRAIVGGVIGFYVFRPEPNIPFLLQLNIGREVYAVQRSAR